MAEGDDYKTQGDASKITSMIISLLPQFFAQFEPMLTSAFGKVMSSNMHGPGGFPMYPGSSFGSTSLFGPQNYGMNATIGFNNIVLDAQTREQSELQEQDYLKRSRMFAQMFAKDEKGDAIGDNEIDKIISSPLAMSNIIHDLANKGRQTDEFQQGIRESQRYMGVGFAPDSPGHQDRLRDRATLIGNRLTTSWNDPANTADWGHMQGRDAGRIVAELQRTGGFNQSNRDADAKIAALGGNASKDDMDSILGTLADEAENTAQQAARSVQAFRQIFQGTVPDVLRKMNALLGTDVVQTFKGAEENLIRNMAATGLSTGFTRHQMAGMAGMSAQFSQSQGLDPWGAAASGTFAAQLMGVHRQTGTSFGVNAPRLRGNMIRLVTGAAEGGISRDISGAYAMIQGHVGDDEAEAFMKEINSSDVRSGAQVATIANNFLEARDRVSANDVRMFSFTEEGETARASGVGTAAALQAQAGFLNRTRVHMVAAQLAAMDVAPGDIKDITGRLSGQTVSVDNIMAATGDLLGDDGDPRRMRLRGALRSRFAQQASAAGLGNTFESDEILDAFGNKERLAHIKGSAASNILLQDLLKDQGPGGMLNNLNAYIQKVGANPAGFTGAKEFYRALTGDTDIEAGELETFAGLAEGLIGAVEGSDTEEDDLGLGIALQAIMTQTFNGRRISKEETARFRRVALPGLEGDTGMTQDDRLKELREIAQERYSFNLANLEAGPLGGIVTLLGEIKGIIENHPGG